MTPPRTDRELARALARGDAAAVDAFYQAHCDAVWQFIWFRVGGRREDADDLTSETFLTALRSIREYEGRSSLGSWLRGIARNKCRERNRLWERRKTGARLPDAADLDSLGDLDSGDLPESVLESREVAAAVSAALARMPERYRRVLVSKYVDELSFKEIAAGEGASPKAIESLVQRARTAFARVLKLVSSGRRTGAFDE